MVDRNGESTHENVAQVIEGLVKIIHRAGFVNGEGDGCGVLIYIPRTLWQQRLDNTGVDSSLAFREDFWVAHLLVKRKAEGDSIAAKVADKLSEAGFKTLYLQRGEVFSAAFGPRAATKNRIFGSWRERQWQDVTG